MQISHRLPRIGEPRAGSRVRVTFVLVREQTRYPNIGFSREKGIYRAAGVWPRWRSARHQRGGPCRSSWTARRPPSRRWCSRRSPSRALAGNDPRQHVVMTINSDVDGGCWWWSLWAVNRSVTHTDPLAPCTTYSTPPYSWSDRRRRRRRLLLLLLLTLVARTTSCGNRPHAVALAYTDANARRSNTYKTHLWTHYTRARARACVLSIAHAAARMRFRGERPRFLLALDVHECSRRFVKRDTEDARCWKRGRRERENPAFWINRPLFTPMADSGARAMNRRQRTVIRVATRSRESPLSVGPHPRFVIASAAQPIKSLDVARR